MKKLSWILLPVIAIGILMVSEMPAKATSFTFEYEVEYSGATPPAGATPWITATFDDSYGGDNTVRLTMTALNLVGTEYISAWYFNFDDILDPTQLSFSPIGTLAAIPNSILTGVDGFKADGGGYFDILFDFPPPSPGNPTAYFTAGETVVYDITYTSRITVDAFRIQNSNDFWTAAKIQAIYGTESGLVTVPDADVMFLLGSSLLGLAILGRKKSTS